MERLLMVFVLSALLPASAVPDDACKPAKERPLAQTIIWFNHDAPNLIGIGRPHVLGVASLNPKDSPRINSGRIALLVRQTNTALYSYDAVGEAKPSEEIAAIQGFVAGLKPYLTDPTFLKFTSKMLLKSHELPQDGQPAVIRVAADLQALEGVLWGANGLAAAKRLVQVTALSATPPGSSASRWDGDGLFEHVDTQCVISECGTNEYSASGMLTARKRLIEVYGDLQGDVVALQSDLVAQRRTTADLEADYKLVAGVTPSPSMTDADKKEYADRVNAKKVKWDTSAEDVANMEKVFAAATAALGAYNDYLPTAVAIERVGLKLMEASPDKCIAEGLHAVSLGKSVDLKATIKPLDLGIGAPITTIAETKLETTLRPDWLFRPSLGVSVYRSPDSVFPTFKAKLKNKENEDGPASIVTGDPQDNSVDWALMLSFTPRYLDWREAHDVAIWVPNVFVNPSEKVRAFGVSAGISFKLLKFDIGWVWTKHDVLDGLTPDSELATAGHLKTKSVFGPKRLFVGFSIVGWAPFKTDK